MDRYDRGESSRSSGWKQVVTAAKIKVQGPAIGLIVVAIFHWLGIAYSAVQGDPAPELKKSFEAEKRKVDQNPDFNDQQKQEIKKMYDQWEKSIDKYAKYFRQIGFLDYLTSLSLIVYSFRRIPVDELVRMGVSHDSLDPQHIIFLLRMLLHFNSDRHLDIHCPERQDRLLGNDGDSRRALQQ